MVLKQFFLDKCPFHFIFLFFHGYPPIDIMICKSRSTCSKSFIFPVNPMPIMTWSAHGHPSHDPAPAFSSGACEEASGRSSVRTVLMAERCLQKYGSCDAEAVLPLAERKGL